jgi:hypothetical protein
MRRPSLGTLLQAVRVRLLDAETHREGPIRVVGARDRVHLTVGLIVRVRITRDVRVLGGVHIPALDVHVRVVDTDAQDLAVAHDRVRVHIPALDVHVRVVDTDAQDLGDETIAHVLVRADQTSVIQEIRVLVQERRRSSLVDSYPRNLLTI